MLDVDLSRPLTRRAAEEHYGQMIEALAYGRKVVSPDLAAVGQGLDEELVAHVLTALGLTEAHMREAAAARLEELRVQRATIAKDEARLLKARDAARDAFLAAESKATKCKKCKHPAGDGLDEAKKTWEKAKLAWAPAARALNELRDFHVPRELHDQETAARLAIADASAVLVDAEARVVEVSRDVQQLAGAGDEEARAKRLLDGANDDLAEAKASLAKAKVRAAKVETAIAAALAAAMKLPESRVKTTKEAR